MSSLFPNLFIIGAMKAGTSSLHEYLHQHPEIFMSRMKEPQYFAPHLTRWKEAWGQGNPYPEPGMDWYLRLFEEAGDVQYAGESSVSYTARPWVEDCEQRIYEFNPDARLIYLLRDPIERTLSHWYFVMDGREDRDLLTAIQQTEEYVSRSHYARQLRPYLERFGRDQVFVLTLEELNSHPEQTFRSLFEWLGVDPDVSIDMTQKFNVSRRELLQTRRYLVPLDTMMKHWRWKKWQSRMPGLIPATLRKIVYRSIDKKQVDDRPAIDYLRPIMRSQTEELEELLGRSFPEWSVLAHEKSNHPTAELTSAT